jgi:YgiT-type zinc finger domain-containing protein
MPNIRLGGDMRKAKTNHDYDYGECEICNTPMQEKRIKQDFWIRGELIVVENVPAGVCPQCGEKIVKADVGRWLMELIEDSERIAKAPRISVPAIQWEYNGGAN